MVRYIVIHLSMYSYNRLFGLSALFRYHLALLTDIDPSFQVPAVMSLATEVIDFLVSSTGKGLMNLGDTCGFGLDVVVVAEGDIGVGAPDVLL